MLSCYVSVSDYRDCGNIFSSSVFSREIVCCHSGSQFGDVGISGHISGEGLWSLSWDSTEVRAFLDCLGLGPRWSLTTLAPPEGEGSEIPRELHTQ